MRRDRLQRDHLRANVQVVDPDTGEKIGHLLDISPGGLGVAGSGEQPPDGDGTLLLRFSFKIKDRRELALSVRRRWVEHTEGHHWHAGYRILELADADIPVLESLMTWYADPG